MPTIFRDCAAAELGRRKRVTLVWTILGFVAGQLALTAAFTIWPQLADPELGGKLVTLRARVAGKPPGQPVVVALGTSHVGMAVRPGVLHGGPEGTALPLVYNLAVQGGDLVVDMICLKRLLAQGIRPDWVVAEVWPLQLMVEKANLQSNASLATQRVRWQDLPILGHYYARPSQFYARWARTQLLPWYWYRFYLLSEFLPTWLPNRSRIDYGWNNLDEWGWQWVPGHVEVDEQSKRCRAEGNATYLAGKMSGFHVSAEGNRVLRDLLAVCKENGISVALIRMPEASVLQKCFSPEIRAQLADYFVSLEREYGVPLIDAHDWVEDSGFSDGHHLTPDGAVAFMQRFEEAVLRPIMAGRKPAGSQASAKK